VEAGTAKLGRDAFERLARRAALYHIDGAWADHLAWLADLREGIHLVSIGRKEPLQEFQKAATEAFLGLDDRIGGSVEASVRSLIAREGPADLDAAGLKGPSSTWTYLVNEDQFGWGVELLKGTNVGLAAGAAAFLGPLFLFTLALRRLKKKRGANPDE
jgi:preprotein translocase subunit SecA